MWNGMPKGINTRPITRRSSKMKKRGLFCLLETVDGVLYLPEVLEVIRMLEVVEGDRCAPELLEVMRFALLVMLCVL